MVYCVCVQVFQLETGDLVISDSVARGTRLECFVTMDTRRVLYKAYNVVAADPTGERMCHLRFQTNEKPFKV